jgi:hypothetical protein
VNAELQFWSGVEGCLVVIVVGVKGCVVVIAPFIPSITI